MGFLKRYRKTLGLDNIDTSVYTTGYMNTVERLFLAGLVGAGGAGIESHALNQGQTRLTRSQIEHTYQTVGLTSDACRLDTTSKACLDAWNKCTENPQSTGCVSGGDTDPVTGQPVPHLSGFIYQHNPDCSNVDVAIGDCPDYFGPQSK